MTLFILIGVLLSSAIFIATFFALKKKAGGAIVQEFKEKSSEIEEVIAKTRAELQKNLSLGSKAQLENLSLKLEEAKTNLAREKENLKGVESKLVMVQKTVEEKESLHQSMKTSKDEDEKKLTDLLANYENIAQESVELEQKLAESMKSLDAIMEAMPMNDNQKAMLQELSDTLTNAGARMRDLLTEYSLVKERLETLTAQHHDLEEEYTRLVEQQLGE